MKYKEFIKENIYPFIQALVAICGFIGIQSNNYLIEGIGAILLLGAGIWMGSKISY